MGAPWTVPRERIGRCGGHDLGPRSVSGALGAFYPLILYPLIPLLDVELYPDPGSAMVAVGYGAQTRSTWRIGSLSRVSSGIKQVRDQARQGLVPRCPRATSVD